MARGDPRETTHPLLRTYLGSPEARQTERAWAKVFRSDAPPAPRVAFRTGYWICMTPRSGSSWLTAMIERTGLLGRPHEFFALELPFIGRNPSVGFEDYLAHVRRMSATKNGVYAMKVNAFQIAPLVRRGLFTSPESAYRYVYLTREDVVRQGISLYRAMESGAWTSHTPAVRPVPFDATKILTWVEWLIRMMSIWETVFAATGVSPLRITYEELEGDPEGALRRIAALVGVESADLHALKVDDADGGLTRQRSSETDEWVDRIRALSVDLSSPR